MDPLAQRLRAEREKQGLSVRDLAVVTKIREPYIDAIERGRYDVLPAVYVKSFVRTIAGTLGISVKEANALMEDVFDLEEGAQVERLPRSKPPEPDRPDVLAATFQKAGDALNTGVGKAGDALNKGFERFKAINPPTFYTDRPTLIIIGSVAGGLIIIFVLAFFIFGGSDGTEDAATGAGSAVPSGEGIVETVISQDSIELTAEVTDSAWLTITMDGQRTQQEVLVPGQDYAWRASERFVLSLSNAGGVRFFRDGEPLPLFGQKGHAVRSVRITRTDVISSTRPLEDTGRVQSPETATTPPPTSTQRRRTSTTRRRRPSNRQSMPIITPAPTQNPPPTRDPDE